MEIADAVEKIPLVGPSYVNKLKKLGIVSVQDLLYHLPRRFVDFRHIEQIEKLKAGEVATVMGQITNIQNIYTKKGKLMQVATLSDGSSNLSVLWFNQPYLVRAIPKHSEVSVSGKVSFWEKKLVIFSPQYELIKDGNTLHTGRLIPIYPETSGVSSKWLRSRINYIINNLTEAEDYLGQKLRKTYKLDSINTAIKDIHQPSSPLDSERARRRLAFDELLQLQIENNLKKITWQKYSQSLPIKVDKRKLREFLSSLPFQLTKSQKTSIEEITKDLTKSYPMNRLLEGDVGSGKTVVAAAACFLSYLNGYQSVVMAPTQILACQHFDTFQSLFSNYKISINLLTSDRKVKGSGVGIVIGTHALISKAMSFESVALVVIDEQHRFGVKQRGDLAEKGVKEGSAPNVLTMTATPIPRTIALSLYGDLDISTLDEIPNARPKVSTWQVPEKKRQDAYVWAASQIKKEAVQMFVVCPLIDDSDNMALKEVKSVREEFKKLKAIFPSLKIGLLHGQMKGSEKEKALSDFKGRKYDILVSTPVVEVGIDIPNATIMLIEAAERYGLAQLHQLRGRVGRGNKKSYCLLFTSTKSKNVSARLTALTKSNSGRDLSELDLKIRGVGEIFGTKQHGEGELKIASWQDIELIKATRKLAMKIIDKPSAYKQILDYFKSKQITNN